MRKGPKGKIDGLARLSLIPEKDPQFESTEQIMEMREEQFQSQLYNKIKSYVTRSNRKSEKKEGREKLDRSNLRSYRVLVRSEQQKQLMEYLGPRVLPVLVQTPKQNEKSKKKARSHSVLDNILGDREKFMKTYFADIKNHRKHGDDEQISYIFPEIQQGLWKISGYIKGKFILLKGESKKKKTVIKKYLYSQVCRQIRKNYDKWVKDRFIAEIQQL